VHQAGDQLIGWGVPVEVDTLDEGGRAVSDADDGNTDFSVGPLLVSSTCRTVDAIRGYDIIE
jgi:hypothetical protein